MTPSAYMTDEAWAEIAPLLAKGIRSMAVVRDHPDWWFILTLDGYGSHINVYDSLQVFTNHKIFVAKEEGDTSYINQAYNQLVAKCDKLLIRSYLDQVRRHIGIISQYQLIAICMEALKKVPANKWSELHKKVNMHPDHRVPIDEWLKRIDSTIVTGEQFFSKNRTSLYDAMAAVWKKLTPEQRHDVVAIIDSFYNEVATNPLQESIWSNVNVRRLVKFASLDQMTKLRASYLAAKRDGSVMVGGYGAGDNSTIENFTIVTTTSALQQDPFRFATWQPAALKAEYVANKNDTDKQNEFFSHMTNYVASHHWNKTNMNLMPSSYLDVSMSKDQQILLNPTPKNVIIGSILSDTVGDGAKKKLARRRIELLSGNVSSYSRCLNSNAQLEHIKDINSLTAILGEIWAEKDANKEKRKEEKKCDTAAKAQQKAESEAAEKVKKVAMMPHLHAIIKQVEATGVQHRSPLKVVELKDLLKYFFGRSNGLNNAKKADLIEDAVKAYVASKA